MKTVYSVSEKVAKAVKNYVDLNSPNKLINMSYGACNDFAASICQLIQIETGDWIRQETVVRYIRSHKNAYRKEIAQTFNNNLNKGQV